MVEWEEGDRFSFEDSDRFEEDSLCSWSTEPESLCNNWRGWKKPIGGGGVGTSTSIPNTLGVAAGFYGGGTSKRHSEDASVTSTENASSTKVASLTELAAKCVASFIPFEVVESFYPPVPEQLQLRIAFWSFPDNEEDIRLYSCLASGAADEFNRGENLHKNHMVKDPLQIGFHLSASVQHCPRDTHNVAVTFDRRHISSCNCTCNPSAYWCSHVVAVCLTRIHWPHLVKLRAPVSESLSRLHREQLQKFAQYLISELPQQILPTAQRLLDELLSAQPTAINSVCGAPDPTAGPSASDQTSWYLDAKALHDNIKKILIKFCVPAPIVFSDVNYLSTVAPPAAAEWASLLRPLRGREPEGMWNLLSIVREMFKRTDRNAIPLLEIITEECMSCDQILIWWFNTKVALLTGNAASYSTNNGGGGGGGGGGGKHNNVNSNAHASQHACSSLCEEIVILWRLAALNPGLAPAERDILHNTFTTWHMKILEKVGKCRNSNGSPQVASLSGSAANRAHALKLDLEVFTGFKPAIEACYLDWDDYPMPGITYTPDTNPMYHCPFTCFRNGGGADGCGGVGGVSTTITTTTTTTATATSSSLRVISSVGGNRYHYHHSGNCRHRHGHMDSNFDYSTVLNLGHHPPVPFAPIDGGASSSRGAVTLREAASSSNSVGGVGISSSSSNVDADGNRSSVSSEGFCENDVLDERRFIDYDGSTSEQSSTTSGSSGGSGGGGDGGPSTSSKWSSFARRPSKISSLSSSSSSTSEEPPPSPSLNPSQEVTPPAAPSPPVAPPPPPPLPQEIEAVSSSTSKLDDTFDRSTAPAATTSTTTTTTTTAAATGGGHLAGIGRDDPWDVFFARAEGLHAHGHSREACTLGVKLAEQLLASPPELTIDMSAAAVAAAAATTSAPPPRRKGKRLQLNPASHQLTCLASATLGKCAFLCAVLTENTEHTHLAFRVGLFGLEMARPPASTKPLEVKLANQESDLVALLKRIPLGPRELHIVRQYAEQLRDGTLKSRGEALLPQMLTSFVFDALVMPSLALGSGGGAAAKEMRQAKLAAAHRTVNDERLAFEAAVAALGLKANVSEADHPLLCEGTRRQRGDLAISLLTFYKDDCWKVARIMERLLDKDVHQLIKTPILSSYYTNNPPIKSHYGGLKRNNRSSTSSGNTARDDRGVLRMQQPSSGDGAASSVNTLTQALGAFVLPADLAAASTSSSIHDTSAGGSRPQSSTSAEVEHQQQNLSALNNSASTTPPIQMSASSSMLASLSTPSASTSSATNSTAAASPAPTTSTPLTTTVVVNTNLRPKESSRYKGKRLYPSIPNQPSEAGAHFMFELAKVVLNKAGGTSSTSLFTQPSTSQNHHGPHRALHICAFQLGLYALGLHNCVSPNWLSRTYSSHVSWITGQAMEIGAAAISFLIDTWEGHLTPPEAASIADRASRGCDANMVRTAAELALSCLPHAHALNPNEIQRAILQCKEQSDDMLEDACLTVESAAKGGGVYPEVLFQVARYWYDLFLHHTPIGGDQHFFDGDMLMAPPPLHDAGALMMDPHLGGGSGGGGGMFALVEGFPPDQQQPPPPAAPNSPVSLINSSTSPPPVPPPQAYAPFGIPYAAATTTAPAYNYVHHPTHHHHHHHHHHVSYGGPIHPLQPAPMQMYQIQYAAPAPSTSAEIVGYPGASVAPPPPPLPPPQQAPLYAATANQLQPVGYYSAVCAAGRGNMVPPPPPLPLQSSQPQQQQLPQPMAVVTAPQQMLVAPPPPPPQQQHTPANHLYSVVVPPPLLPPPPPAVSTQGAQILIPAMAQPPPLPPQLRQQPQIFTQTQLRYLLTAYRVGMLALETLARRVHDDRPQAKYARNPPYGEDIKWLLMVSKRLGTQYLHQFCMCVVNSIVSPFVLHDVAIEAAHCLSRHNPGLVLQHLRTSLSPLVQKCQQMYIQCMHQKLYHLTAADYEDFVSMLCNARAAFQITPEGNQQFKEWLQSIRRSKSCKKDLWAQINAALQTTNPGK